jgi:hypothetical protein
MTHPRNAFGVSPSRGRPERTGKAGSAAAAGCFCGRASLQFFCAH